MSLHDIRTLTVSFPELDLPTRAAHQLRGYFGTLFREHSELLHNHYADGTLRYAYPLVQYKVLAGVPTVLGLGEGASLLGELFLKIRELDIDGRRYPLRDKRLTAETTAIGVSERLRTYGFETMWMALNQDNHRAYVALDDDEGARAELLDRLLRNHILAFYKGVDVWLAPGERVFAKAELTERSTNFKSQRMLAFDGTFTTNAVLPEGIGLGKSVSRGFGTVTAVGSRVRTGRRPSFDEYRGGGDETYR